jgi:uncharacterized damage-inducible protein DinB
MPWTAPDIARPGGSLDADEAVMLRGLLEWHRTTFLHKCAGLTAEQLAQCPIPQSNLSLQGLIRHLAKVERTWFRRRFGAEDIPALYSTVQRPDADFEDIDPANAEAEYAVLLAESQRAREITDGVPMQTVYTDNDGDKVSLRFLHIHMIGEYARHNGHADMIRQCVDGVTGA